MFFFFGHVRPQVLREGFQFWIVCFVHGTPHPGFMPSPSGKVTNAEQKSLPLEGKVTNAQHLADEVALRKLILI